MKKRFLGIICLLYAGIIIYVKLLDTLKNYLAPNMQNYIILSIIPLLIMGLVQCLNDKVNYKFKISDLILLLPMIMLILSKDGRLTTSLATNRSSISRNTPKEKTEEKIVKEDVPKENEEVSEVLKEENENVTFDFSKPYFDVVDASYDGLANYITYIPNAKKYEGKTIRVKGFTNKDAPYIPKNYFALGKYSVSCCAADAMFVGFIAKYEKEAIKNNTWYEIEGVLEKGKDKDGVDIMTIKVINIHEIDGKKEEQYVYPCYAYDNGACEEMQKYDLNQ